MHKSLQMLSCLVLASSAGTLLYAQDVPGAGALELRTVVQRVTEVVDEAGVTRTELVPVQTAVPGDEVVYTVTFTNIGTQAADNIVITNPIPEHMRLVKDSAFAPGAAVVYSTDGGATYAAAEALRIVDAGGNERLASAEDYTHIRWAMNVPLEVGEQGFTRFRAVVR
jgi:uncharacterized repeat protein (TIGR01451 family)